MKRLLKLLVLVPVTIVLVIFLVINRAPVTLTFDPLSADAPFFALTLPLFVIICASFALGVLAGGIGAWIKQGKWRKAAREEKYEATKWRHRADRLKEKAEAPTPAASHPGLPAPETKSAA